MGYWRLIVPKGRFSLLSGENNLETYTFDTHVVKHLFCRTCGIKSFYILRSHPDGISVNARCLDKGMVKSMSFVQFDGKHWEENIHKLKPINE
jgi:hypothetical protein